MQSTYDLLFRLLEKSAGLTLICHVGREISVRYYNRHFVTVIACGIRIAFSWLSGTVVYLQLNRAKSVEIIFENRRRRSQPCYPPALSDIRRVTSIKILGVTFTNHLSMSDHLRDVIARCGQTLYALKVTSVDVRCDISVRTVVVGQGGPKSSKKIEFFTISRLYVHIYVREAKPPNYIIFPIRITNVIFTHLNAR